MITQIPWARLILALLLAATAHAHPGGLDTEGGHVCRTDCARWGLEDGEYHHHERPTITGTASVIDGDTIEIHGQRIRLHGIDAPESNQLCTVEGEPWRCGHDAALKLAEKIGRQPVVCEQKGTDRYQRVLAVCFADQEDLNAWLVAEGWAVAYRRFSLDYAPQEEEARRAGKGIWRAEFEMPWEYRR